MTAEQLKAKFKKTANENFPPADAAERVRNFDAVIDALYCEPDDQFETDDLIFIMTGLAAGLN